MGAVRRSSTVSAGSALAAFVLAWSGDGYAEEPPEWIPPTSPPSVEPDRAGAARTSDGRGSLRTTEALGTGNVGMSLGGGVAVLLPFYGFEVGVGLTEWLDLVGRWESVIGVFHYPALGIRAQLPELENGWRFGFSVAASYSFFGIKTDQVNLTSTFYSTFEVGLSGPVTDETDLVLGAGGEVDFFELEVVDGEDEVQEALGYDATVLRAGLVSAFGSDFHGYAQLRVRVPTETFTFEAQELYVIPMIEIGGTWTF